MNYKAEGDLPHCVAAELVEYRSVPRRCSHPSRSYQRRLKFIIVSTRFVMPNNLKDLVVEIAVVSKSRHWANQG